MDCILYKTTFILLIALILDWFIGEPDWLWKYVGHPVTWFGKLINFLDKFLNRRNFSNTKRFHYGIVAILFMISTSVITGILISMLLKLTGLVGIVLEIMVVAIFLAQKSLRDHVQLVSSKLRKNGLVAGQEAVKNIIGRDYKTLGKSDICKASIESLAENFSDGVVAPALWYLTFGIAGILCYKIVNTADSMIGYKSSRYFYFGKSTAKMDDFTNFLPARISVLLIALGGLVIRGKSAMIDALNSALTNGRLHPSPNSGWPEAAMAGVENIVLGGNRYYRGKLVVQSFINDTGRQKLTCQDIDNAVKIFDASCYWLWFFLLVATFVF